MSLIVGDRELAGERAMVRYEPTYHTIVEIDVAGSGQFDDREQLWMRAALRTLLADTLALQSLDAAMVGRLDLGDGLRLIFPATVSPCLLLDPLIPNLASGLHKDHEAGGVDDRLRLRVAVHAGLLHRDSDGWAGAPLVHCSRLIGAEPVRRILHAERSARLVLVVSEAIYDSVVRHGYGLERSSYRSVKVRYKETVVPAWVYVPEQVLVRRRDVAGRSGTEALLHPGRDRLGQAPGHRHVLDHLGERLPPHAERPAVEHEWPGPDRGGAMSRRSGPGA
jgi:hypothetical protein